MERRGLVGQNGREKAKPPQRPVIGERNKEKLFGKAGGRSSEKKKPTSGKSGGKAKKGG